MPVKKLWMKTIYSQDQIQMMSLLHVILRLSVGYQENTSILLQFLLAVAKNLMNALMLTLLELKIIINLI